jgi:hypothetical protein
LGVDDVHNFQISALVLLDHIWMARNKLIHEGTQPNPQVILKLVKSTITHHLSAWSGVSKSMLWTPPPLGSYKVNFDVAIQPSFAVAAATLRNHQGEFLAVNSLKLPSMEANLGEAHAALLAVRLAVSFGYRSLVIEGDSLVTILAINDPSLFFDWSIDPVLTDIKDQLLSIPSWKALKISRCANFGAHHVARWAASNLVFGCIPTTSLFLSFVCIRSGKDPSL